MSTKVTLKGELTITDLLTGQQVTASNLVVAEGRTWALNRLCNFSQRRLTSLVVGNGTAAVTDADLALSNELFSADITSFVVSGNTLTCEYYLPAGAAGLDGVNLTEAGIMTDSNTVELITSLFARVLHTPVAKTNNNSLLYSWVFTLTAA